MTNVFWSDEIIRIAEFCLVCLSGYNKWVLRMSFVYDYYYYNVRGGVMFQMNFNFFFLVYPLVFFWKKTAGRFFYVAIFSCCCCFCSFSLHFLFWLLIAMMMIFFSRSQIHNRSESMTKVLKHKQGNTTIK